MTQYGFFFDQSRCYGCKACSVACKGWYDIAPGPEKWMSVYMWEKGRFPNPSIGILAFNCGHCDNPVCAATCENGAIFKEDKYGAVLIDQASARAIAIASRPAPYGAPKFASDEPGTKMSKCTMCIDRLENDQLPLCVASCPRRALDFGPIDELRECEDKTTCDKACGCLNHLALRVASMDEFVAFLGEKGIAIEAGPFDPPLEFDRPLGSGDDDLFTVFGDAGTQLRIMFFRGPGGERFEVLQDNIKPL